LKSFNYCDTSTQDSYCPFPNKALYEGTEISFSHPSSHNILLQWKEQPKRIFFLAKFDTMMWKEIHETLFYLHGLGIEIVVEQTLYDFIRGNSICNLDHHPPEDMVISSNPNTLMNRSEVDVNDDDRKSRCMDYPLIPLKIFQHGFKQVDLIITFGGDGLLLHCNTLFAGRAVPPVMCFDFGSLGFLSPFLYDDLEKDIRDVLDPTKEVMLTLRMRLECRIISCSKMTSVADTSDQLLVVDSPTTTPRSISESSDG
jgi:NAD kinase